MDEKRVTVGEIISEIITRMKQLGYESMDALMEAVRLKVRF